MAARGRPVDQAARERIVTAGTRLFLRDGYFSTTVGAIAEEAQVAVKTLYAAHGSKLGVLSAAHDHAVSGDTESTPLLQRAWALALPDAGSLPEAWTVAAEQLAESTARSAPILTVIRQAAADPGVAELQTELRQQRHAFSLGLARILLRLPGASALADPHRVADVLYATMTAESYTLLVTERGWTVEQWGHWVHDVIAHELTGDGGPT